MFFNAQLLKQNAFQLAFFSWTAVSPHYNILYSILFDNEIETIF